MFGAHILIDFAMNLGGRIVGRPPDLESFAQRTDPELGLHPETGERLDGLPDDSVRLTKWNAEVEDASGMKLVPRDGGKKE